MFNLLLGPASRATLFTIQLRATNRHPVTVYLDGIDEVTGGADIATLAFALAHGDEGGVGDGTPHCYL
jgi:hypothetical protein